MRYTMPQRCRGYTSTKFTYIAPSVVCVWVYGCVGVWYGGDVRGMVWGEGWSGACAKPGERKWVGGRVYRVVHMHRNECGGSLVQPKSLCTRKATVSAVSRRGIGVDNDGDGARSFGAVRNQGRKGADNREGRKGDTEGRAHLSRSPTDAEDVGPPARH